MNIFSRRKRLLNRTPARANPGSSGFIVSRSNWLRRVTRRNRAGFTVVGQASGSAQFRRIFRRNRAGTPATPKMSSRRQFHRALRRHPAWPAVMELAAARAQAQKAAQRDRAGVMEMGTVSHRKRLRRILHRNRTNVMTTGQASSSRTGVRRILRRNRTNVMAMQKTSHRARVLRNRAEVMATGKASASRTQLRRALRRNRTLVVALLAVGALVALLTGLAVADGTWKSRDVGESTGNKVPARFGAATTFDGTNNEMLIFGGFVQATPSSPIVADNDTRGFKGGNHQSWINRTAINNPTPKRGYAAMAYDAAHRNVVLFGGAPYRSTAVLGDTWIYNGSDWTKVEPSGPTPPARQNHVMVYDAHRKEVVMFGGRGAPITGQPQGETLDDTWTWNGSAWTKMKPPVSPKPRHSAAMAYDLCRGEAVLFGGNASLRTGVTAGSSFLSATDSVARETWTWNGTTWKPETALVEPLARIGASMLYSSRAGRVMLYGGLTTTENNQSLVAADTDIWSWGETAGGTAAQALGWEKYNSELTTPAGPLEFLVSNGAAATPPPRAYASFEYAPGQNGLGSGAIQLFGGTPADPSNFSVASLSEANFGSNLTGIRPGDQQVQVAFFDQWYLTEGGTEFQAGTLQYVRGCKNPVPIPPDEVNAGAQVAQGPPRKLNIREEIKETGARLPVLLGTPWLASKNPKNPNGTPNPNYAPPPDCPSHQSYGYETVSYTHLATDPKRNRVYQFFFCDYDRGKNPDSTSIPSDYKLLIRAYHGTTLKPLGSAVVPIDSSFQYVHFGSGNPPQHDAEGGRFLFSGGNNLYIIGQDLLEKGDDPLTKVTITGLGGGAKWTFFNHPTTGRAKLLIAGASGGISQLDLLDNRVDWSRSSIEGCSGAFSRPMRTQDRVYFSCTGSTGGGRTSVVRLPVVAVANDTVANDGEEAGATAEAFPGPPGANATWGDPKGERFLLLSSQDSAGSSLWVFDGKVSRYVGRIPVSGGGKPFLDEETGRFYVLVPDHKLYSGGSSYILQGGLRVVDTRLTPVAQAQNFGQFSYTTDAYIGVLPPHDGLPRRIFVRRGQHQTPFVYEDHPDYPKQAKDYADEVYRYVDGEQIKLVDEMHYKVLADELPIPEQPDISDLDALTIPVAEKPGKTEVGFDAEASAYGIRLRSVGGIASALRFDNVNSFDNPTNNPSCFYPDRELIAGWVTQVHLSDVETSARTSGLEVDSSSKVDLEGVTSRCQIPLVGAQTLTPSARGAFNTLWPLIPFAQTDAALGANLKWDNHFKQVECVGDANANHRATLGNLTVPAGSAAGVLPPGTIPAGAIPPTVPQSVTATTGGVAPIGEVYGSTVCNQKDGRVEGIARGALGGGSTPAEYSVGEGYSKVVVAREAARGVVVTATAVATGIKLPGISIGYVKTEAVAWSNGRYAEKRASFTRKICNVEPPLTINPYSSDKRAPNAGCYITEDEQKAFVAQLNGILTNNNLKGKATLPTYDPDYYKGSPEGYAAGVIKPIVDEVEDAIFTSDVQREVPGLRIVFYKDSFKVFGRQVLELAGVRGFTGYGIQCSSDRIYSPTAKDCVELTFQDDPVVEEFEEEEAPSEDTAFNSYQDDGGWVPVATGAPSGLALGSRIGRFIENLPLVRLLPIRAMGEALLAASVWLLLGLPLLLASQRFAMNRAKGS